MENGEQQYRRFLAGDAEGLREIIREYQGGLMLYLNGIVQNIHTAEDLTEDTFAEIAIRKPHFSGKSLFKTWLYAIGRHLACKHLRKQSRQSEIPLHLQELVDTEQCVESRLLQDERARIVRQAMHTLRTDYRSVLHLSFFEEMSNEETAAAMGKNRRQVENLLYNAKKALRAELERRGFPYEEQ